MKYTAPQLKIINEADIERRSLERQGASNPGDQEAGVRHLLSLLRAGEIDHIMLKTAAAFGNEVAQNVCKIIGEIAPTIESPADILHMFALNKDEYDVIFTALGKAVPDHINRGTLWGSNGRSSAKEMIAWTLGRVRHMGDTHPVLGDRDDWRQVEQNAQMTIGELADEFGLDWIIQTLKPILVHPRLQ